MRIIVDSGSTKCTWLLTDSGGTRTVRTEGINAVQYTAEQIRRVVTGVPDGGQTDGIYFYGAGCGPAFPAASEKLRCELAARFGTDEARIVVESDLLGAARALFGRGEGIACILGTGSNSCRCRGGGIVETVPPLGYILGDEGSGAVLGRNLLNGIFKGHIPLREELLAAYRLTYEQTIRRVYSEPCANRFLASFAPFIAAHADLPEVREMVMHSFSEFARRNLHRYPEAFPVAFTGGIAAHFEPLLREAMAAAGCEVSAVVESPAEGLLKYHYGA